MAAPLLSHEFETLVQLLKRLHDDLPQHLALARESGRTVELDQQSVGRLSRIDAIAQQSVSQAGLERLRSRLAHVRAALRRVEDGAYGDCIRCEEPIGFPRLSVSPETPFCLECQENRERG